MRGFYATMTPLPASEEACNGMIAALRCLLEERNKQGRLGKVLDESYAKIADYSAPQDVNPSKLYRMSLAFGSSWALRCFATHGYHRHFTAEDEPQLRCRRVLFFADRGFTAEIYPFEQPEESFVEVFEMTGLAIAELEFDGSFVHRFRPLDDGELFAISLHSKDRDEEDTAAETQTEAVSGEPPGQRKVHKLISPLIPSQPTQKSGS